MADSCTSTVGTASSGTASSACGLTGCSSTIVSLEDGDGVADGVDDRAAVNCERICSCSATTFAFNEDEEVPRTSTGSPVVSSVYSYAKKRYI